MREADIISTYDVVMGRVHQKKFLYKVGYFADTISALSMKFGNPAFRDVCISFKRGFEAVNGLRYSFFIEDKEYIESGSYKLCDVIFKTSNKELPNLMGEYVYFGCDPLVTLSQIKTGEAKKAKLISLKPTSTRYRFQTDKGLATFIIPIDKSKERA